MPERGQDPAAGGREALRRHAWHDAFEQLRAADATQPLPPEDLERLGEAAEWIGRLDDCIAARERAHAGYLERGQERRADFAALLLTHTHFAKGQGALAMGWLRRAERLIGPEPESIEYGHLVRARALVAKNLDDALAHARASHDLAARWEIATSWPWGSRSRGGSWSPRAR